MQHRGGMRMGRFSRYQISTVQLFDCSSQSWHLGNHPFLMPEPAEKPPLHQGWVWTHTFGRGYQSMHPSSPFLPLLPTLLHLLFPLPLLPLSLPLLSPSFLSESPEDKEDVYAQFLSAQSCYDVIPSSTKIVVLDTRLRVKKAFFALVANGRYRFCNMVVKEGHLTHYSPLTFDLAELACMVLLTT